MFTDADSLCSENKTDDIYKVLIQDKKKIFDNSDYPKNSEFFFNENMMSQKKIRRLEPVSKR